MEKKSIQEKKKLCFCMIFQIKNLGKVSNLQTKR